jgi:arylsulfatase A-like enzyme
MLSRIVAGSTAALLFGAVGIPLVAGQQQDGEPGASSRPNIVLIVADDAGYADFSVQGSAVIRTPRIDSIGASGVRFTQGYVTAPSCSPSRAGLLTGRYQQRFGHEFNPPWRNNKSYGLPVAEKTLADLLQQADYQTIAVGKWHLGLVDRFHPSSRGFDDYYGFLGGGRSYWYTAERKDRGNDELLLDRKPDRTPFEYLTDEFGSRAAAYITKYRKQPFFLYLAFNAPHTPLEATAPDLARVASIEDPDAQAVAAMTVAMDRAVGRVLDVLEQHGLAENTLVVFVSDNGGRLEAGASNGSLRDGKFTHFEGGIRVPFLARWPRELPSGQVYDLPVSALDIVATALSAAGVEPSLALDGVDLLPFVTGEKSGRPHPTMFWRRGKSWAIREGDWKLIGTDGKPDGSMLFDLASDPTESTDLAAAQPERVQAMKRSFDAWAFEMVEPLWRYRMP